MLSVYPACFFKEDNGYSVIFPDLDWLATCGTTLNEAMERAVDCLAGYLYMCQLEGDDIPEASDMASVNVEMVAGELDISVSEAFVNMVAVDVESYAKTHFEKSVKKTLSIPAWLNKLAMEQNINFSQILQEALIQKLRVR